MATLFFAAVEILTIVTNYDDDCCRHIISTPDAFAFEITLRHDIYAAADEPFLRHCCRHAMLRYAAILLPNDNGVARRFHAAYFEMLMSAISLS